LCLFPKRHVRQPGKNWEKGGQLKEMSKKNWGTPGWRDETRSEQRKPETYRQNEDGLERGEKKGERKLGAPEKNAKKEVILQPNKRVGTRKKK